MIYKSVRFKIEPNKEEYSGILSAFLDAYNYEGIYEEKDTIIGYISIEEFSHDALDKIRTILKNSSCILSWKLEDITEQNWNLIWERNFDPVIIANQCLVRAPFHEGNPQIPIEIIIEPKMSFGTGHHQTTSLMMEQMLRIDFENKSVLDMGCGTGLLSILASKLGASEVIAVDIDKWSYENTVENIEKNSVENIQVILGSSDSVPKKKYNIVLANINLNVILDQMFMYSECTARGSRLLLSGIIKDNEEIVLELTKNNFFSLQNKYQQDEWLLLKFDRN